MRAVRVLFSRFHLSSLIALLALCGSTPAWSTIVTEFGNTWNGVSSTQTSSAAIRLVRSC